MEWPEQYGEDKLVIILMGVFTLSKQHGVQLEHGLKTVGGQTISETDAEGPATASSLLNCGNLKKTRCAH